MLSTTDRERTTALGTRLVLLAVIVTALAYAATVHFAFVYDDDAQIVSNPTLSSWKVLPFLFTGHSWKFLMPDWAGNYYRPVFMTWLLLNKMLFGINPAPWHATTALLHVLATFLSFLVARQVLRNGVAAGFVAILFGLHPIHVESVAWVSGVTDPLMGVFVFAAFWAWVRGEREPDRRFLWQILAAIFYAGACLSKETGLFLPVVVVAYDVLFGRDERTWKGIASSALRAWPLGAVGAAYMIVRGIVLRGLVHPVGIPLHYDLLTIPTILWGYMRRLVWPVQLAVSYETVPVSSPLQWRFWLPLLAWILVGVVAWRIARRSRVFAFSAIWFFAFLAPAIVGLPSFLLNEWIHDRYLYLPVFGFCLLLAHAITQLPSQRELFGMPAAPTAVVLILAALMAFGTSWEEQYWVTPYALFSHNVEIQPKVAFSKAHLANELFKRGRIQETEELYLDALQLEPKNWRHHVAYGLFLFYSNQYEKSDRQMAKAIAMDGSDPNPYFYQGMSRFNLQNYAGAQQAFEGAIQHGPNRARYHFWRGFALERQYKFDEARKEYEEELREHPDTDTVAAERLKGLDSLQK